MALKTIRFACERQLVAASNNKPPLQKGSTGEGVAILQQALVDLGFSMPISTGGGKKLPDGIFGRETAATVKAFQRAHGLAPDEMVGPKTLAKLEDLLIADAARANAILVADMNKPPGSRSIVSD